MCSGVQRTVGDSSDDSPGDVFVHDSVETVVKVAAGELKPQ